jgi:hypothetical protein
MLTQRVPEICKTEFDGSLTIYTGTVGS